MRSLKRVAWVTAALGLISMLPGLQTGMRAQNQILVWTPQPLQANPYIPPNKPVTRLTELRAKHASEQNWTETIVDDNLFRGQYISMAPGAKTPKALSSGQSRVVNR